MDTNQPTISIGKLEESDFERFVDVIRLFENVFEREHFSMPGPDHLRRILSDTDFFVFAAFRQDKVVGGLTAYVLDQYYSEKPLAYIYDLAVYTKYQRQGIGKMLLAALNSYCASKGFEEVFVQADKVDNYAIDFYRSTAPTSEEDVAQFNYLLDKK